MKKLRWAESALWQTSQLRSSLVSFSTLDVGAHNQVSKAVPTSPCANREENNVLQRHFVTYTRGSSRPAAFRAADAYTPSTFESGLSVCSRVTTSISETSSKYSWTCEDSRSHGSEQQHFGRRPTRCQSFASTANVTPPQMRISSGNHTCLHQYLHKARNCSVGGLGDFTGAKSFTTPAATEGSHITDEWIDALCSRLRVGHATDNRAMAGAASHKLQTNILQLSCSQLLRVTEGLASSKVRDAQLWSSLVQAAFVQAPNMDPLQIVRLLKSLAMYAHSQIQGELCRTNVVHTPVMGLFARVLPRTDNIMRNLPPSAAADLVWAYAKAGIYAPRLLANIYTHHAPLASHTHTHEESSDWTPVSASKVLWSAAVFFQPAAGLVDLLLPFVHARRESIAPGVASMTVHSVAMMQLAAKVPPTIRQMEMLQDLTRMHTIADSPQNIVHQLWQAHNLLAIPMMARNKSKSSAAASQSGMHGGDDGSSSASLEDGTQTAVGQPIIDENAPSSAPLLSSQTFQQCKERFQELKTDIKSVSKLHAHVERELKAAGFKASTHLVLSDGLTVVDVLLHASHLKTTGGRRHSRRLVLEIEGPSHYLVDLPTSWAQSHPSEFGSSGIDDTAEQQGFQVNGRTLARNALLKKQACVVVTLPYWRWVACKNSMDREALLREVLEPVAKLPKTVANREATGMGRPSQQAAHSPKRYWPRMGSRL